MLLPATYCTQTQEMTQEEENDVVFDDDEELDLLPIKTRIVKLRKRNLIRNSKQKTSS
jgi:hypothetical protein